jgi:hypothetical protein
MTTATKVDTGSSETPTGSSSVIREDVHPHGKTDVVRDRVIATKFEVSPDVYASTIVSDACVRHMSSRHGSDIDARGKTLTKARVSVEFTCFELDVGHAFTRPFNGVFTCEEGTHANEYLLDLLGNDLSFE